MGRSIGWLAVALLLPGCATNAGTAEEAAPAAHPAGPVVVAVLDGGVNPYLDLYLAPQRAGYSPPGATIGELARQGAYAERVEADRTFWESTQEGRLYHFNGTRLSTIGFSPGERLLDERDHGAHTAYLVAREAPDVHIVSVQVHAVLCVSPSCLVSPTVAAGMEWIAAQPWIDIVSVSLAVPGNPPDRAELHPEMERYLAAIAAAAASGKLVVNAAGNQPVPTASGYFNGPPSIIAVGGFDPEARGEAAEAGKGVDVVSNFTEWTPDHQSVGEPERMGWRVGTSFGTPVVAGTLAAALAKVRAAGVTTTSHDLREALNASAASSPPLGWEVLPPDRQGVPWDQLSPTLPILVQPQMGWGYVNASLADEIARRVIEQDFTIPPGKEQAELFQPAWQQAREEFWRRWASS